MSSLAKPVTPHSAQLSQRRRKVFANQQAQVSLTLLLLTLLCYWSYFLGLTVVNGDVNAHYMADSYYWWNHGGILNPPSWLPYVWMGRPAGSNLQDGSYVLSQGIGHVLAGWSPTTSAIVSALTTAFGAAGMYLLARAVTKSHFAGLVALVGQFFAPGVFANAQFLDIQRGATLAPWFLLICSPLWRWDRRWGLPIAAVLLWQIAIGTYPGQLIGALVCVGAWTLTWLLVDRKKGLGWIWRLLAAGSMAAALSLVKLAPALLVGTGQRNWEPQRILLSPEILATLIFPYDNPAMPWDIALRPFFLATPLLLGLALAGYGMPSLRPALVLSASALALILLVQFAPRFLESLPLFDLSRFQINDFRTYLMPGLILMGAHGLRKLAGGAVGVRRIAVSCLGLIVLALALGSTLDWGLPWLEFAQFIAPLAVAALTIAVALAASLRPDLLTPMHTSCGLLALSILSGLLFAYSVTSTWASLKPNVENQHYGSSFASLETEQQCDLEVKRRPARTAPTIPAEEYWHDFVGLRSAYDCSLSISGYANIPGSPTLRAQERAFKSDDGSVHKFYTAAGAVSPIAADSKQLIPADLSDACLHDGQCANLRYTPLSYDPDGELIYDIHAPHSTRALLNESYYPGWNAEACTAQGSCRILGVDAGPAESIQVKLPAGDYILHLKFRPPYADELRAVFWMALVTVLASAFIPARRR